MIPTSSGTAALLASLRRQPSGKKAARTLAASRFVDFPHDIQDKSWRRRTAEAIQEGAADGKAKMESWRAFALSLAGSAEAPGILFARQESRLLMNMAGGVFENGGLLLDRVSGLPFIPGSAVKGCARRLALAALQEWTSGELSPGDDSNPLAAAIEGLRDPADLLLHIALIFGWSDLEWKGPDDFESEEQWRKKRPDFAWACGDRWMSLRESVAATLCGRFSIPVTAQGVSWKKLPHYAGSLSFLPAYPWEKDPGIDLEVVTCHHGEYYKGKKGDPAYATAPDTEEPVPVVFPAVASGKDWAFLIHPTARAQDSHLKLARSWLAISLETLGIGAKTNAGYGWFDASEKVNSEIRQGIMETTRLASAKAELDAQEALKKQLEEQRRKEREAKAAATEGMTTEQKTDWEISQWSPAQFSNKLQAFFKEPRKGGPTEDERKAIVRALRGPRLEAWPDFKAKAQKGDLAKAADAIRQLNKQLYGDKMP